MKLIALLQICSYSMYNKQKRFQTIRYFALKILFQFDRILSLGYRTVWIIVHNETYDRWLSNPDCNWKQARSNPYHWHTRRLRYIRNTR